MANPSHRAELLRYAARLGYAWRHAVRSLSVPDRDVCLDLHAEILQRIGLHLGPKSHLNASANLARASADVRAAVRHLAPLALREAGDPAWDTPPPAAEAVHWPQVLCLDELIPTFSTWPTASGTGVKRKEVGDDAYRRPTVDNVLWALQTEDCPQAHPSDLSTALPSRPRGMSATAYSGDDGDLPYMPLSETGSLDASSDSSDLEDDDTGAVVGSGTVVSTPSGSVPTPAAPVTEVSTPAGSVPSLGQLAGGGSAALTPPAASVLDFSQVYPDVSSLVAEAYARYPDDADAWERRVKVLAGGAKSHNALLVVLRTTPLEWLQIPPGLPGAFGLRDLQPWHDLTNCGPLSHALVFYSV